MLTCSNANLIQNAFTDTQNGVGPNSWPLGSWAWGAPPGTPWAAPNSDSSYHTHPVQRLPQAWDQGDWLPAIALLHPGSRGRT